MYSCTITIIIKNGIEIIIPIIIRSKAMAPRIKIGEKIITRKGISIIVKHSFLYSGSFFQKLFSPISSLCNINADAIPPIKQYNK